MGFIETFLGKTPTKGISIEDVHAFIDEKIEENMHLDYTEMSSTKEPNYDEIGKIVSSFLNSDGGLLCLGVSEQKPRDETGKVINIRVFPSEVTWSPPSLTKEKLEHILRARVQPWDVGILIAPVRNPNQETQCIFLIDIPKSKIGPHMTNYRFYIRSNFETKPMEYWQVADMFKGNWTRDTLLRNLKAVIEKIPQSDLPANIVAVYAFGGMLREKDRLHDFDLVFLYSMTYEQEVHWKRFYSNFSTYDMDSKRRPISELMDIFEPYRKRGIPLGEAVKDNALAKFLSQKGIPPHWAGCFSWTEILYGPHGNGNFSPDLRTIIRKMLIGRRFRGLQVFIGKHEDFERGEPILFFAPKNYVLAWTPEKPNIEENLENRPLEEKIQYAIKELDFFINESIPTLKEGTELEGGYLAACESVMKKSLEADVKIDIEALDKQHVKVVRIGDESYAELLEKLELARDEMRKYRNETIILNEIADAVERWIEVKKDSDRPAEDYVSLWAIEGVGENQLRENEIRKILRILKLPEERVITVKGYGFKYHSLAKDEEDKKRLLREADLERLRSRYLRDIIMEIRPLDSNARVYLDLTEQKRPKRLRIITWRKIDEKDVTRKKAIMEELTMKGYCVKGWTDRIEVTKEIDLKGGENLKKLQNMAKQIILHISTK